MSLLDRASTFIQDLPTESITRIAENLVVSERDMMPLVICFYITYRCNAACEFCSQGDFVYGADRSRFRADEKDTKKQIDLLNLIRQEVPNIYLLGGEPTVHPGFRQLLEESSRLDFENVAVNTNGILFKPEILEHADLLVMSLHSADAQKTAAIYQTSLAKGEQVYENFRRYAQERDPNKTKMVVNCVVTGDNISDAYKVAELAARQGVQFNIAPAIEKDGLPDQRLIGNKAYQNLIEWVARQKSGIKDLSSSSLHYLQTIKTFEGFTCNPHAVPGLHPNGDLIVPCPNLPEGPENVNLLAAGSVRQALKIGRERWEAKHGVLDTQLKCRKMCHKTCYVETASLGSPNGLRDLIKGELRSAFLTRPLAESSR